MSTSIENPSAGKASKPITVPALAARKGGEPIVCLTAYTAPMARLLDPHCDLLLVGDSIGMVLYGFDSTLPVTLDMMIAHGAAVVRGASRALVAVDLPFSSYEESPEQAYRTASRVLQETGAAAVKLEGGRPMAPTIRFLTERGIPVLAHVGLTPQTVHALGGFGARGRDEKDWQPIIDDALAVADAGAFATVVEGVAEPLARKITEVAPNPIIGIGASPACDGQILVTEDMLGLFPWNPKFVKRYADLGGNIERAVEDYAAEVRARTFPGEKQTYAMKRGGRQKA